MKTRVRLTARKEEIDADGLADATAVVIDVLRATTSMAAALAEGAAWVLPVAGADVARTRVAGWAGKEPRPLLAGEQELRQPDDFDLGNSPQQFTAAAVQGRGVVMATTNGTVAVERARSHARQVIAASLINREAVCQWLVGNDCDCVEIICSGSAGSFSLEDWLAGGLIIDGLLRHGMAVDLEDKARAAWLASRQEWHALYEALLQGRAARRLTALGMEQDVVFTLRLDVIDMVPLLREERFVDASRSLADAEPTH